MDVAFRKCRCTQPLFQHKAVFPKTRSRDKVCIVEQTSEVIALRSATGDLHNCETRAQNQCSMSGLWGVWAWLFAFNEQLS
eukprot:1700099-Amphidinium_carterae.1